MKTNIVLLFITTVIILISIPLKQVNAQLFSQQDGELTEGSIASNLELGIGTSFSTGLGGSAFFTQSISPVFTWDATNDFSIQAGTVFSSTSIGGSGQNPQLVGNSNALFQNNNLFKNTTYALGHYTLNNNLTFTGGAYFESSNFDQHFHPHMNEQAFNLDAKGMIMGFSYKINDNMRIGAEFNVRSGPSSYYNSYSPFNSPGFYHRQTPYW